MASSATGRWRGAALTVAVCVGFVTSCSSDTVGPGEQHVAVAGRVFAPAGFVVEGLSVSWWTGRSTAAATAQITAGGAFELSIAAGDSTGDLVIEDESGALHPFQHPFRLDDIDDLRVVLVPRRWTVRSGIHAGETVQTSLDPVVSDNAENLGYTYFFAQPSPRDEPTTYRIDLMTWPTDALPAKVAFDHRNGSSAFSADDSVAIWGVLDRMEEVFGLDLFEPAVADPGWWPDAYSLANPGFVSGVIRLIFDPPRWSGLPLGADAPETRQTDIAGEAAGSRFHTYQVSRQRLNGGTLEIGALEPLRLADGFIPWPTVLIHEMLHVLGVGHTCRVPSPMGPCVRTAEPSVQDVAYMEVLREVLRLEREHDTTWSIVPAIIGERRRILGRPALPGLDGVESTPSSAPARTTAGRSIGGN